MFLLSLWSFSTRQTKETKYGYLFFFIFNFTSYLLSNQTLLEVKGTKWYFMFPKLDIHVQYIIWFIFLNFVCCGIGHVRRHVLNPGFLLATIVALHATRIAPLKRKNPRLACRTTCIQVHSLPVPFGIVLRLLTSTILDSFTGLLH